MDPSAKLAPLSAISPNVQQRTDLARRPVQMRNGRVFILIAGNKTPARGSLRYSLSLTQVNLTEKRVCAVGQSAQGRESFFSLLFM